MPTTERTVEFSAEVWSHSRCPEGHFTGMARMISLESRPLVSVIMSAYNCEALIGQAIESVLKQTLSNLELIVVDDASTDRTAFVIQHYMTLDRRVHVVRNRRNSRAGPVEWEPRNDGLKIARGQFIAYLDADNSWRPHCVERLAACLMEPDKQVVHCDSCNHYSKEHAAQVRQSDRRRLVECGRTWNVFSYEALDRAKLGVDQYVDTNEMMHRASVFDRLGDLWRTLHPNRDYVNAHQSSTCPKRRHNDLDLFERIIDKFGIHSAYHLSEALVDYYYSSYKDRPAHVLQTSLSPSQARCATSACQHIGFLQSPFLEEGSSKF